MERETAVAREFHREQAYVDRCLASFERLVQAAGRYADSAAAMPVESPEDFFEREVRLEQARKQRGLINIDPDRLVLGRVDLDTDETFYVGRVGVESADGELLVMDWRAPLSASFYQATAARPSGVDRRRSLACRHLKVVEIDDEVFAHHERFEPVIGEAGLLRALDRHRGRHMSDIVGTIQADQDAIIRYHVRDSVVVSGGPGTGKTVVALHRVAYVMYERAEELERRGVLVIGPSERFADYISKVLPSLGETAVQVRSATTLIDVPKGTTVTKRHRWDIAIAKGALRSLRFLRQAAIDSLPDVAPDRWPQLGTRRLRLDATEVTRLREQVLLTSGTPLNAARQVLADALTQHLADTLSPAARSSSEFCREVGYYVDDLLPIRPAFETWAAITRSPVAAPALAASLGCGELAADILHTWTSGSFDEDDLALVCALDQILGNQTAASWDEIDDDQDEPLLREVVSYQDTLDMRRARTDIRLRRSNFGLVVLDEAQDLTPMQLRAIKPMGDFATWLVVGDDSQSALQQENTFAERFRDVVGTERTSQYSLSVNYRTPAGIARYAQHTCGVDGSGTEYARPSDGLPRVWWHPEADDHQVLASRLATIELGPGSTAVIVPENLVTRPWPRELDVLTPTDSKGLEWDNVVAILPESFDLGKSSNDTRSLAYVALTRPTRHLLVLTRSTRFTPSGLFQPWQLGEPR